MKNVLLIILFGVSIHCAGQTNISGTWSGVDKNGHPIKLVFEQDSVRITNDVLWENKWPTFSIKGKYSFKNPRLIHILYYEDLKDPKMCEQEYFDIIHFDENTLIIKRWVTKNKKEVFEYKREK